MAASTNSYLIILEGHKLLLQYFLWLITHTVDPSARKRGAAALCPLTHTVNSEIPPLSDCTGQDTHSFRYIPDT